MYPSINNNGNISFTSINVQPMKISSLYNYNINDANNLSKTPREHSSSSFHLLSPHYNLTLEDETNILSDLLQQENPFEFSHDHINNHHNHTNIVFHQQQHSTHHDIRPISLQSAMQKCSNNNNGKFVSKDEDGDHNIHVEPKRRSRTSNKDRHSKINTAKGPRDRRMRLSIDIAKKFFKLQDMLGFDKASKTVEWLLIKSNSGIQELQPTQKLNMRSNFMAVSNNNSTQSSTSNCEVLANSSSNCIKEKKKGSIGRSVRKSAYLLHSPLAKETRERARARARERTAEKSSKIQCSKSRPFLDQVPSSTNIDQPEQQISHHNLQFKQGISGGDDDSSLMTANWSPSMFNYQHSGALLHEHQFNDFQIIGNLWEGNN